MPDVSTVPSLLPSGPVDLLDSAGSGSRSAAERGRLKLTPDQAVHIFLLGRTKTADTAAKLASKYGISAKAIRDIWTKKSWAQETCTHWTDTVMTRVHTRRIDRLLDGLIATTRRPSADPLPVTPSPQAAGPARRV